MIQTLKKCAIYTRKSTEEGLDQEFNSLNAQRVLCEAYITSQKKRDWIVHDSVYDDGGYTGGNIDRPGLKRLLEDIALRVVDVVLVYKIDRLSRSLTDFSKLIDMFAEYNVTFISVTQDFNTATPMGKLSMNVLLSFAQYERELIGERIRDKYIASKKKGMWTGGVCPLGYQIKDKHLEVLNNQAGIIREIYRRYIDLKSVPFVMKSFVEEGFFQGQSEFMLRRGHIYKILKNPIYMGRVKYRGVLYEGLHTPLVSCETWQEVQNLLRLNTVSTKKKKSSRAVLLGKLFDADGVPYSRAYTKKKGWKYSYYVSQNILQHRNVMNIVPGRLPEQALEDFILNEISEWMGSLDFGHTFGIFSHDLRYKIIKHRISRINYSEVLNAAIKKIVISWNTFLIKINLSYLAKILESVCDIVIEAQFSECVDIVIPYQLRRESGQTRFISANKPISKTNKTSNILGFSENYAKGVMWRDKHFRGQSVREIACENRVSEKTVAKYIDRTFQIKHADKNRVILSKCN